MKGLFSGDCADILIEQEQRSINLIMTSPPYADARNSTYGGIPPNEYVEWWMKRAKQFSQVLREDGSLVVNIKEKVTDGERSTYVLELILAMRQAGWLWTEEYIWHKKNPSPGKWPNRFRDAWERCLHFTLQKKFAMYQEEVMVPVGDWAKPRLAKLGENDVTRHQSATGSSFGRNVSNWVDREFVFPTNVLYEAAECGHKNHPAVFPEKIPEFFIKLFTKKGDLVLDPFVGSGTTCVVAKRLEREFIGIDLKPEYIDIAENRLATLD